MSATPADDQFRDAGRVFEIKPQAGPADNYVVYEDGYPVWSHDLLTECVRWVEDYVVAGDTLVVNIAF